MEKAFFLIFKAQHKYCSVQISLGKHRCSLFYGPNVLVIDLCQGHSGILGEQMVEMTQDYEQNLKRRRTHQLQEWGAGGDWQEESMDGRIRGDEAGEVEKQDAALKMCACPTEKLWFHFVAYGDLLRVLRRTGLGFQHDRFGRLLGWKRNESRGTRTNWEPIAILQAGAKDSLNLSSGREDEKRWIPQMTRRQSQ